MDLLVPAFYCSDLFESNNSERKVELSAMQTQSKEKEERKQRAL